MSLPPDVITAGLDGEPVLRCGNRQRALCVSALASGAGITARRQL
ncbi:hypothetical protein [Pseudomaricurvus alkylphenolicus]|nr:hypothetical protein [Pseudomaricurvus alkylphenolicus]